MTPEMLLGSLLIGVLFAVILIRISHHEAKKKNENPIEGEYFVAKPSYDINAPFILTVIDVFEVGDNKVITGLIEGGVVQIHDTITITNPEGVSVQTVVLNIEMLHKYHDSAQAGMRVGITVSDDIAVSSGDCLTKTISG